jgi:hypothetical protein
MGTAPSNIALEVALRSGPNMVLLAEEVDQHRKSLQDVVKEIANLVRPWMTFSHAYLSDFVACGRGQVMGLQVILDQLESSWVDHRPHHHRRSAALPGDAAVGDRQGVRHDPGAGGAGDEHPRDERAHQRDRRHLPVRGGMTGHAGGGAPTILHTKGLSAAPKVSKSIVAEHRSVIHHASHVPV